VTDIESRASDLKAQAEIMQVMLASLMESLDEVIYPEIRADQVTEGMEIYRQGEWREVVGVGVPYNLGVKIYLAGEELVQSPYAKVIARPAR
jgi:hypothetical protein